MRLLRYQQPIPEQYQNGVVTIGNFDGVHYGHQQLLRQVVAQSAQKDAPSILVTFEPHPQEFFQPQKVPPRLTRLREKWNALQPLKLDAMLCLRFDQRLAKLSAQDFVRQVLVDDLCVQHVLVGHDFHFGYQRRGDFALLQTLGEQFGFTVAEFAPVQLKQQRVSSSRIRACLAHGELAVVEEMLDRPYSMEGRVIQGDGRGSAILGIPTANIALHRMVSPLSGVYAVQVAAADKLVRNAVANIGTRPTVDGTRTLLEVHVLDFNGDLYAQDLQVFFRHKLRDEVRYDTLDALVAQIQQDIQQARKYFQQ